jgi:hypothetical protein
MGSRKSNLASAERFCSILSFNGKPYVFDGLIKTRMLVI